MPANFRTQGTVERDPNLYRIIRMTSLFISQHNSDKAQKIPLSETLDTSSSQVLSDNLSPSRLVKALLQDSSQPDHTPQCNLLIVLGNTSTPSPTPVVTGALIPGMPWATNPDNTEEKKREWASKLTCSHILFQLQPQFRLLRWTGSHMPLSTDFIRLDDEATADWNNVQLLKDVATDSGVSPESYWIGAPERTKNGLHIDPDTKIATLTTTTTPNESDERGRYEDIGLQRDGNDDAELEKEFLFRVDRIAVFRAESGTQERVCSGEILSGKDDSRYGQQGNESRVEREELAKRIQGFGST